MTKIEDIIIKMRQNPKGIRFRDTQKVCDFYFGEARQKSGSHAAIVSIKRLKVKTHKSTSVDRNVLSLF